ncbi:MAG: 16S rRNA (adenine(1518)-N(6)/adenine(1519)-N(6))-dimethyltransferase RsmA [Myxococcota bacterium]
MIPPWEDPRTVLARHGGRAQKRFSQNFLTSPHHVERIAAALRCEPNETVVEIGPGVGSLTGALLRAGARVIAIEKDPTMRHILEAEFASAPLDVRDGDAKALNLGALVGEQGVDALRVCGNLPYAITGPILRRLVEQRAFVKRAVIMVQKEVATRLAAQPATSAYGVLSVFVQACFDVEPVSNVRRGAFHPPPKVDSSVVALQPRAIRADVDSETFRCVVKAAFAQRRKTLRNAVRRLGIAPADAGIDGQRRGETLSVEEFDVLAKLLV